MTKFPNKKLAYAGVDVGSLTAKSVILVNDKIAGFGLVPSGIRSEESGLIALQKALESAGLTREDLTYVVATGYGRISAPYANKTVTEITCHAKGAHFLHPETRTIIDPARCRRQRERFRDE